MCSLCNVLIFGIISVEVLNMAYKDKSKAIEYNNEYNRDAYDRVSLMLPKGQKAIIKAHADAHGESLNGFINRAIKETMERDGD